MPLLLRAKAQSHSRQNVFMNEAVASRISTEQRYFALLSMTSPPGQQQYYCQEQKLKQNKPIYKLKDKHYECCIATSTMPTAVSRAKHGKVVPRGVAKRRHRQKPRTKYKTK